MKGYTFAQTTWNTPNRKLTKKMVVYIFHVSLGPKPPRVQVLKSQILAQSLHCSHYSRKSQVVNFCVLGPLGKRSVEKCCSTHTSASSISRKGDWKDERLRTGHSQASYLLRGGLPRPLGGSKKQIPYIDPL